MRKGLVLTLDAIIAILITTSLLASVSYFWFDTSRNELVLDRLASDTLFILDRNGTLEGKNNETINNAIRDLLPDSVSYDYNMTYFTVGSDGSLSQDAICCHHDTITDENKDIIFSVRAIPVFSTESGSSIKELDKIVRAELGVSL